MPVVSEPWFEFPVVTEWTWDKANGTHAATNIEHYTIKMRDVPSVMTLPPEVLISMNQYDAYIAEEKERAMEEAKAEAKARR